MKDTPHKPPIYQVVLGFGDVGVIRAQAGLVDAESPQVVLLHLLKFALVLAQECQVVQLLGHVGVIRAQHLCQGGVGDTVQGQLSLLTAISYLSIYSIYRPLFN